MKAKIKYILIGFLFSLQIVNAQIETPDIDSVADWHHTSYLKNGIYGIGTDKAYEFLKENKVKPTEIIVAVLDGGIDLEHPDLQGRIWTNPKEIPNNQKDDDNNGYIDDIHGWSFIGGEKGDVVNETLEITRLYTKYNKLFEGKDEKTNEKNKQKYPIEYVEYVKIKAKWEEHYAEAKANYEQALPIHDYYKKIFEDLAPLKNKKLTKTVLESFKPTTPEGEAGLSILKNYTILTGNSDLDKLTIDDIEVDLLSSLQYSLDGYLYLYNPDFDPRPIVGDNYEDVNDKHYGNNHVDAGDVLHGTHVSGIIGAIRDNKLGGNGIAGNFVKIMPVRMVANGDERDKDVANAIRYAVDNGAKIINMSFGKSYSPQKEAVWEAMKYAESKGVLLIHAAGNDNKDIDKNNNYPTNFYQKKGDKVINTWIEVGASTRNFDDKLKASFSNYGKVQTDIFAPGAEIYATIPNGKYQFLQGTSMAAPVVAGSAAVLWAHYPKLTAKEVKDILMTTANKPDYYDFEELSVSGGVVDLSKAVKKANEMTTKK